MLVFNKGGYVAQEFNSANHADFLTDVDLDTETEGMDTKLKATIMRDMSVFNGEPDEWNTTYVNADFHVKYQVFLDIDNGKRVVDVGGLPLRYFYRVALDDITRDEIAKVVDVEVFKFPEEEFSLQDRAVMFFQTAAILRQFSQDNKPEFNRFLGEVSAVVRGQDGRRSRRRR